MRRPLYFLCPAPWQQLIEDAPGPAEAFYTDASFSATPPICKKTGASKYNFV